MVEKLRYEKYRYQRNNKSFCVVMCDIDKFKDFNDKNGHDCGDYVLKQLAKVMLNILRKQDIVSRWGGEEFLILLPETSLAGSSIAAEKLRKSIESTEFHYKEEKFNVTITCGLSVYNENIGIKNCVKEADMALYEGKEKGRNCVIAFHRN